MKTCIKILFVLILANTQHSFSQSFPINIADNVAEWGAPINCEFNGYKMTVRVKLNKHMGTTCFYDVEFTNNSTKNFNGFAGINRPDDNTVYRHNAVQLKLKPGESVTYLNVEKRECKLSLSKKRDQVKICRDCNPYIAFILD